MPENLQNGESQTCGKLQLDSGKGSKSKKSHGKTDTRLYRIWENVNSRCNTTTNPKYPRYGGRGISVCREWSGEDGFDNFRKWANANGYRNELTLDRINFNGNYSPSNCRWTTLKEQASNKSSNRFITIDGEKKTLTQWCNQTNISRDTLYQKTDAEAAKVIRKALSKKGRSQKMDSRDAPKLKRVIRLDSVPLNKAYYTEEGYLIDDPILTSTGIFEYTNDDGSIRRELRLPEEVFDKESLASYVGKPIVVTHGAGLIDKDNVQDNAIGTILSEGRRDHDNVRAHIVIHDTDAMKRSHLKELSLGYNLELDETPGDWHGEHYDAIQRNIRVNHLALVLEARAGEQARLNIDGRDPKPSIEQAMKGARIKMRKTTKKARRNDGTLSPEEFAAAIKEYKAMCAKRKESEADGDDEELEDTEMTKPAAPKAPAVPAKAEDADDETGMLDEPAPVEDTEKKIQEVKDRRDVRDEQGEPQDEESALNTIAEQDEDIQILFDIIDTLMAQKDYLETSKKDEDDTEAAGKGKKKMPGLEAIGGNEDDDEEPENALKDPDAENEDEDDDEFASENEDEDDDEFASENEDEDDDEFASENEDEDDEEDPFAEDCDDDYSEDGDDDDIPNTNKSEAKVPTVMNIDSVDRIVRQRIQLGMVGQQLGLNGLENMKPYKAKKAVIKAVHPGVRLDGKSKAYINAAYDYAVKDVEKMAKKQRNRKSVGYQKRQMFNKDSASRVVTNSSTQARQRMIKRQLNKNKEAK